MKAIKLLLTDNVDNLGIVGDVVSVRPGYARNFLLPRALATTPTPGAIKRLAERRAIVEAEVKARRAVLEGMLEKLKGHEITVQRSANEQGVLFGGVSQHEIAEVLQAEGFSIEDRMVRIGQQIKRLDSYTIPIVLASDLRAEVKLWVVSDKPSEQLETEKGAEKPAQGEDQTTAEADAKPEKPKKPRKERAPKAEGEAPAEAAATATEDDKAKADKPRSEKSKGGKAKGEKSKGDKTEA